MRPPGPLGLRQLAPIAIQRQQDQDASAIASSPALNSVARQAGAKKKELVKKPGNMNNGGLSQGSYTGSSQIR